ncbi:MAG: tRNA lysidine(34) synthetase TilS [Deltaproteobacteria bacterium]|jgi:tRNA(Ile)-lysidine synthase|nr:tRNA lysidine(34) synthetase TilS [Deltaproteobacteria bacterium]
MPEKSSQPKNSPLSLTERFRAVMARLCSKWPSGRYLCAYSGGLDSTALLGLFSECLLPENILVAHLDHGLRAGSDLEALAARRTAENLGLTFRSARFDVASLAGERGKGLEEAARKARYDFLTAELERWGGDWIVTAHHADDQAETIVLRLARGVGPGGLAGILEVNGAVIRPLLDFTRAELADYLKANNYSWLEDPSNDDERFDRNRVRHKILPVLQSLNTALVPALGRVAKLASAEEDFWQSHLDRLEDNLVRLSDDGRYRLEAAGLKALTLAERRRLVGRVLRKVRLPGPSGGEPVSFLSVENFLDYANRPGAGGVDLPGGRRAEWRGRFLYIGPASRYMSISSG